MDRVRTILGTLAEQAGVNMAMIVSRDGFVVEVESARELPGDAESIGASISSFWNVTDRLGDELAARLGLSCLLRYRRGVVGTAFIPEEDLLLAVYADRATDPAAMRYLTTKYSALLGRAL